VDAVILFSHGSLLCGSGEALDAHAERLRAQGLAPFVEVGYLNYSTPLFIETVARCVAMGAERILVTPYFLVPGYFVKVDLPKAVAAAQAAFPQVTFVVAEAIGFDEALADALIESAFEAVPASEWRRDLQRASQYCRANPQCPLYGSPACPRQPAPAVVEASV
jgi:sirohydrochlorin ferrochelatase